MSVTPRDLLFVQLDCHLFLFGQITSQTEEWFQLAEDCYEFDTSQPGVKKPEIEFCRGNAGLRNQESRNPQGCSDGVQIIPVDFGTSSHTPLPGGVSLLNLKNPQLKRISPSINNLQIRVWHSGVVIYI